MRRTYNPEDRGGKGDELVIIQNTRPPDLFSCTSILLTSQFFTVLFIHSWVGEGGIF